MKQNIPGIFNYCDRWCGPCDYKNRCAVYANSANETEEEKDISNQAYWNKISRNLKKGLKLLHRAAEEYGVDLDNISGEEEAEIRRRQEEIEKAVMEHPLITKCGLYARLAREIMQDNEFWEQERAGGRGRVKGKWFEEHLPVKQMELMKPLRETIQWYMHFIGTKFRRALSGKLEGGEGVDLLQNDSNGSARVALICLERTSVAWKKLFELIPDEDRLLPVLALLSRIEKIAREEFPFTEHFIRPGFDD